MEREARTSGYGASGGGSVFSDRLFSEFPYLWGYEASEDEAREIVEASPAYSIGLAGDGETDRQFGQRGVLPGYELAGATPQRR
ncbi:hypothetical protein AAU61_02125 [Desulfocarbo indianensis]|nr:hypothetical protein AAU61_02125 [Desulfocarbo indianensis]